MLLNRRPWAICHPRLADSAGLDWRVSPKGRMGLAVSVFAPRFGHRASSFGMVVCFFTEWVSDQVSRHRALQYRSQGNSPRDSLNLASWGSWSRFIFSALRVWALMSSTASVVAAKTTIIVSELVFIGIGLVLASNAYITIESPLAT